MGQPTTFSSDDGRQRPDLVEDKVLHFVRRNLTRPPPKPFTVRESGMCTDRDAVCKGETNGRSHDGRVTGMVRLYADMEESIRSSLVRGFSLALFLIFLVFCVQLRSVALGAIAMIPNVVPIVVSLGVMGYAGISLDSMTCMVASIAIGLAVDDSIHFVSRIRRRLEAGLPMRESLAEATVEVGRALVYTSITLCCGFGVMMIATFVGIFYFGLLCTLTVAVALVADLLLLPVVFRWYGALGGEERVAEKGLEPSVSDVGTESTAAFRTS